MLFRVFTISLDLQKMHIFLKRFLLELFIMLYVTLLSSGLNFETYKLATIKLYNF